MESSRWAGDITAVMLDPNSPSTTLTETQLRPPPRGPSAPSSPKWPVPLYTFYCAPGRGRRGSLVASRHRVLVAPNIVVGTAMTDVSPGGIRRRVLSGELSQRLPTGEWT